MGQAINLMLWTKNVRIVNSMRIYQGILAAFIFVVILTYVFFAYGPANDLAIEAMSRLFIYRGGIYFHVYILLPVAIILLSAFGSELLHRVIFSMLLAFLFSEMISKNLSIFLFLKDIQIAHLTVAFSSALVCIFLSCIFFAKNKKEVPGNSIAISVYIGTCLSFAPLIVHLLNSIYFLANPV